MKLLILGGTTEAMALARRLAGDARFDAQVSLAGRTLNPVLPPLPTRIGGFGGVDGLKAYLRENSIQAVVDATHPFADRISANAAAACAEAGVPLVVLGRPGWTPEAGDRWIDVPDMEAAAAALDDQPGTVFLTVGRQEVYPFESRPERTYVVRAVDPPDPMPKLPHMHLVLDRGPFDLGAELALIDRHQIGVIVSKNSGGGATAAKLEAARQRGIPVVMVKRPKPSGAPVVHSVEDAMAWLAQHAQAPTA